LATPEYAAYLPTNLRFAAHPPTPLAALADSLVVAGVRHVNGAVQADDTRHEPLHALPGWKPSFIGEGTVTPLTALTVNGGLAKFDPPRVPMAHPALGAAGELTRLLRERGVQVDVEAGYGAAPPAAPELAQVQSAPLVRILAGVLRASDNSATELIVREVGLAKAGLGSTEAGLQAVQTSLHEGGVGAAGLSLRDGSGLDAGNRASCQTLAETLDSAPAGVDLPGLLPVAGRSGTLWRRFVGTPLEGRLTAKTGWINGVVGLAGRIDGRTTFALIQNGVPSLADGQAAEEGLLEAIVPLIPA
jgi:D-alanyl-D-alanine carboxypeptidase/D-alanyl-D-alanine-endopeptidase (penicillin-binding protein 4)